MTPEITKAKTQEELNRELYLNGVEFMRPEFIEKMATPDEINRDLDAAVRRVNKEPTEQEFLEWLRSEHPKLHERWMAGPRFTDYSAEDIKTTYDALRTYLHLLIQQPAEDYEEIARTTKLIIAIKPQAVEASQEIAGRENNARTT